MINTTVLKEVTEIKPLEGVKVKVFDVSTSSTNFLLVWGDDVYVYVNLPYTSGFRQLSSDGVTSGTDITWSGFSFAIHSPYSIEDFREENGNILYNPK